MYPNIPRYDVNDDDEEEEEVDCEVLNSKGSSGKKVAHQMLKGQDKGVL